MYDPSIGRFTTQDPLSEDYYNLSSYGYCAGSPIACRDENGEWINFVVGGIIGGATEYLSQVAVNVYEDGYSPEAFSNVDIGDIALSTVEGVLTSGASALKTVGRKALVKVGGEILRNATDVNITQDGIEGDINSVSETSINTIIGLSGDLLGGFLPNAKVAKGEGVKKAMTEARKKGGKITKEQAISIKNKASNKVNNIKEAKEKMVDLWKIIPESSVEFIKIRENED